MDQVIQQGLIRFGNWTEFARRFETIKDQGFTLEEELCKSMGIDWLFYEEIVNMAIYSWQDSTSKSTLHGFALNGVRLPQEGSVIFDSLLSQTRFLIRLGEAGHIPKMRLGFIRDERGERIKVRGEYAVTYPSGEIGESIQQKVNSVLQALYLYLYFCKQQTPSLKLAKKLYRGVRMSDILGLPQLREIMPEAQSGVHHLVSWKAKMDSVLEYIRNHNLQSISESNLLSFTASKSVAEYFSNKRGLVLEIDPNDVDILTSEAHDARLSDKDYVSKKQEREYIVRLSDVPVRMTDIHICDTDYLIATNNPLAVRLFNHDTQYAFYELNGVRIEAHYVWRSNTSGGVRYYNLSEDGWGCSSREFQRDYGFSPVISERNLKDVNHFYIEEKDNISGKVRFSTKELVTT